MSQHEFHVEKVLSAGAVTYRLSGVMGDAAHCFEFSDQFLADLETAPARIVFSLRRLETMYSAGIGILANCFNRARKAGKDLVLAEVPAAVQRVLTITGVEPMVKAFATEAEALSAPNS